MTTPPRQTMQIGAAIRLGDLRPGPRPVFLKLLQHLLVVPHRVAGQTPLLAQMAEKGDREGIRGRWRFGFQAAAAARALAVFADLGFRGSRGGKSNETLPSFQMRKAEKGRRVFWETNFSNKPVFPSLSRA